MSTVANVFYPDSAGHADWDGTDPSGGDFRALLDILPTGRDGTTECNFTDRSAGAEIVCHPYVSHSTVIGSDDATKWGWAVKLTGSNGMGSLSDAKRFNKASVWTFEGTLSGIGTSTYSVTARVYRVLADNTRSFLFSATSTALLPTAVGASWGVTSASQPELLFEAGETFVVSYSLIQTSSTLVDTPITFNTGVGVTGNQTRVITSAAGIRTAFIETVTSTGVGTVAVTDGVHTVTGTVYDSAGNPVSGATVKLFNQSTDVKVSERPSAGDGTYTFYRADNDSATYWLAGHSDTTHHGTTDRDITAT